MNLKRLFKRAVLALALLVVGLGAVSSSVSLAQGQIPPVRTLGFGIVYSVAFSPDGRYLAAGGAASAVHLIDTTSWQVIRTFEGHSSGVTSVAFSPDGRRLASGAADDTVRLWDISDLTGR